MSMRPISPLDDLPDSMPELIAQGVHLVDASEPSRPDHIIDLRERPHQQHEHHDVTVGLTIDPCCQPLVQDELVGLSPHEA